MSYKLAETLVSLWARMQGLELVEADYYRERPDTPWLVDVLARNSDGQPVHDMLSVG